MSHYESHTWDGETCIVCDVTWSDCMDVCPPSARQITARNRGEQVTACSVCGALVADPLHWMHEERHFRETS